MEKSWEEKTQFLELSEILLGFLLLCFLRVRNDDEPTWKNLFDKVRLRVGSGFTVRVSVPYSMVLRLFFLCLWDRSALDECLRLFGHVACVSSEGVLLRFISFMPPEVREAVARGNNYPAR